MTGAGEEAGGRTLRLVEIVCSCGVRTVSPTVEGACRAYAHHMFAVHGRTVSCTEARSRAHPVLPSQDLSPGSGGDASRPPGGSSQEGPPQRGQP